MPRDRTAIVKRAPAYWVPRLMPCPSAEQQRRQEETVKRLRECLKDRRQPG